MGPEVHERADRSVISCCAAIDDLGAFDAIIDVRSESEFAADHVPGALNCPVLTDAERAQVGTLHRNESAFDARRFGAALVARNIARHLETTLATRPLRWRPLVYCWRGGQRSGAMTHVLARIGWPARQLEGGYRAYRRCVVEALQQLPLDLDLRVVCGTTGSGKSRLLRELERTGAQVLDLEALANHRGSVLGNLPQQPQPSQKMFETRIWWTLRAFDPDRPVYVESESRKVGELRVPDALIAHMRQSRCVVLELPLQERIRLLRDEYRHLEVAPRELARQLDLLVPLHGRARIEQWKALADENRWHELVERLLEEHYDPAYRRSIRRNFASLPQAQALTLASADMEDYASAARRLLAQR